jgi:16S rRNA processing protein RimM
MEKIKIGYVQGVHGLRGDLKIKNKFESPEKVFVNNNKIYLNEEEHTITACKFYKGFYLVTIDNLKNINLVEKYIGYDVYFKRDDLNLKENEYLYEDLYDMEVESGNKTYGKVSNILDNGIYKIIEVKGEVNFYVPLIEEYVEKVDTTNRKIICKDIKGLIL